MGIFCKNYLKLYKEFTETPKLRKEYDKHKELFQYLSEKTGWTIKHYGDVFYVYWGLRSEVSNLQIQLMNEKRNCLTTH